MKNRIIAGLLAGGAGTTALNAVTYADMALRGRPASEMPEHLVEAITERAGIEPGDEGTTPGRRQGLAGLLGIATGLGVGVAYGLAGGAHTPRRAAAGTIALTVAASLASDAPATVAGLTDPRTWTAGDLLADLVPHLAYGAVTAITYDRLTRRHRRGLR
ncbi:hypothetical protein GCM10027176_81280 [Actinoallomurus bryophytorum]|uniref:Uncharacterized protein n=1 Tax=Actinoallomurus bryophytorum TaxID=1490222 RepID=A0A543CI16_9ACTN|nr:hypothetical protein [Actinoallomurus bryophytorum]TQL96744.1 hypothetical protein FB559_2296 [Actinoallomurus bryophytorum]